MPIGRSTFVRWAALTVALYLGGLAACRVVEPMYLDLVVRGLMAGRFLGLLPAATQMVVVPGRGLALAGAWPEPLAVDQHILDADLALTSALMLATLWLPWRLRLRRMVPAWALVFLVHLATIAAQASVHGTTSAGLWATWKLWVTVYQGKVVPIAIWYVLIALPPSTDAAAGGAGVKRTGSGRKARPA